MSPRASTKKDAVLVIGGPPRADLLPPEIKHGEKLRSQRRGLVALLILVLVVVVGGYVGATYLSQQSANVLTAANAETAQLQADQVQYAKVSQANAQIAAATAARRAATTTEIDWKSEIADVVATLPSGSTLTSLTVLSGTPGSPLASPSSPLEGNRVAELSLTVSTSDIPDTAKWIRDLATLDGFVDATPSSISAGDTVTTSLLLHLNDAIYWNRFAPEATK
jgi:Tfp pilus assembly protein PilN